MADRVTRKTRIEAPVQVVFDWHKRPGALERLIPPWQRAQVVEHRGTIRDGDRVTLRTWMMGVASAWVVEHRDYVEGRQFRDLQLKGPFARWEHLHTFEPIDEGACFIRDDIEYELPLGGFGDAVGAAWIKERIERMLAYRHRLLVEDLAEHKRIAGGRTITAAVSGATGLVGSALTPFLTTGGHRVKRIVRGEAKTADQVTWLPLRKTLDTAAMEGVDAVIHLAGENLFGRWTDDKKQRIRDSRVVGTRGLATALAAMDRKPRVLICASAVGYYGSRGDETLTEDSERGGGESGGRNFLADVCDQWEQATQPAAEAGIRVVNLRIAPVLSPRGGALAMMAPIFRLGLGGTVGGGAQWMPWVTPEDLVSIIHFAIFTDTLHGPINAAAPNPVRNRGFVETLGRVLNRPTILPAPTFAIRWALGDLADEMLLSSLRVTPLRLAQAGYPFRHTELEPALRAVLGR